MCESFNNSIITTRFHPIISMLEAIRCNVTVRIQENMAKSEMWHGKICPNIFKKLKLNITRSAQCQVPWNGKDGFEVKEKERRYIVNLETKICSCRYWQLSYLPCCHAISAIYKVSKHLDDYIADCYYIEEYKKTYDHFLMLVEGKESWPDSGHPKPEPPAHVRMPGKPRKERTRETFEPAKPTKLSGVGTRIECGLCNKYDHNSRKCPLNPEVGKKKMAYIRRLADKKRKRQDAENTVEKGALLGTQQSSIITDPVRISTPIGINKPTRSKPLGNKTGARKVATGKKSGG